MMGAYTVFCTVMVAALQDWRRANGQQKPSREQMEGPKLKKSMAVTIIFLPGGVSICREAPLAACRAVLAQTLPSRDWGWRATPMKIRELSPDFDSSSMAPLRFSHWMDLCRINSSVAELASIRGFMLSMSLIAQSSEPLLAAFLALFAFLLWSRDSLAFFSLITVSKRPPWSWKTTYSSACFLYFSGLVSFGTVAW